MQLGEKSISQNDPNLYIFDHIQDDIIAIDNHSKVIYWNKGAEELYEIKVNKILGKRISEAYSHYWLNEKDENNYQRALEVHGKYKGRNLHIMNNNEVIYVEWTSNVIYDETNNKIGVFFVIRSIYP